ncbi:MAG: PepSY domain-containing protein [Acinetobacter populi]|jgi:uncharacterized iron-regulated membrane protein|uniref:PepSY-associated TM helix domain-containing protein n=1 Tax=Acinetobacter populi TaxID=1582270 RepID=UPI002357EEA8|nr:PepSY-associated TM helix domain-containing protein [Acinetobacter populi]MCH4248388.1 PepSY domain-containing protein [Acinetobacter populi]
MRVDGKKEGPRQSMSWLHTWISLLLGWLLYAIFLTGTLSFFQNEITIWMKPELHQSLTNQTQQQQLTTALKVLQERAPEAAGWNINLPTARQTTTSISIQKQGEQNQGGGRGGGGGGRGGNQIILDTATGEEIKPRETRGGGFLYRFHFELYGMDRSTARWIVGIATMFMFVAIISGIITHKKIFKDFFTFRPGKGQRSWLDAHNATAVFALPFHLMITFSGLLLLMYTLMPYAVNMVYEGGRREFLQAQNQNPQQVSQPSQGAERGGEGGQGQRGERGGNPSFQGGERGEGEQGQRGERGGNPNFQGGERAERGERGGEGRMQARGEGEQGQRGERGGNPNFQGGERAERGEGGMEARGERGGNPNFQAGERAERGERGGEGRMQARGEGEQGQRGERGGNPNFQGGQGVEANNAEENQPRAAFAKRADITKMLDYAQQQWKDKNGVASVSITAPNTVDTTVEIRAISSNSLIHRNQTPSLKFNGVTGELIPTPAEDVKTSVPSAIYNLTTWLHQARGVDLTLRWILFLSGVLGTMMVATGLVLWVVKRAPEIAKLGYKPFGHRVVESLNVAAVVGLPIACAAYFWANRFIPAQLPERSALEIKVFFIVWLVTLIHSAIRPYRKAWLEQLALVAVMYALTPIINFATGGRALWSSIYYGQWVVASFDIICLLLAVIFAYAYYKLYRYPQTPVKVKRVRPAAVDTQEQTP